MEGEGRSHSTGCFGYRRVKRRPRSPNPCVCPQRSSPSPAPLLSTPPPYKMKRMKEIRSWLSYRWANHNPPHRSHSYKDINVHLIFYKHTYRRTKHTGSWDMLEVLRDTYIETIQTLMVAPPMSTFTQKLQNEGTMVYWLSQKFELCCPLLLRMGKISYESDVIMNPWLYFN